MTKNKNNEVFRKYFGYQNSSLLPKYLDKANQTKSEQWWNDINKKKNPENRNTDQKIDIAEKTLDFKEQQKGKELIKILIARQMQQRFAMSLEEAGKNR